MNIMQLCLSPDKGGLELYVIRLVDFLQDRGNVSVVLADNTQLLPDDHNLNCFVYQCRKNIFSALKIAKIIDKDNIDVLHIHWTKDLSIAVLAKKISKKKPKLIQTRHMGMTRSKNDFYHRFLYQNLDLIIAVTQEVQTQLKLFIDKPFRPDIITQYIGSKIPIKISEDDAKKLKEKYHINASFIAVIVGRIEYFKGQHIAIEALAKLVAQGIDIQLLVIGSPMLDDYLKTLKHKVSQLNLDNHIIFTGFITNTAELMQLGDVVILATKEETFGLVLTEAMQANIAVIASNSGGPLEIIEDKKTGLLFESFNVSDLTKKIMLLYKQATFKKQLADNGQKEARKRFEAGKQFQKILNIYEKLKKQSK